MRLEQDDARRRVKRQGKHANVMARATGSTIVDADVGFVDERPDSEGEDAGDDGGSWVDRYVYLCTRLKEMQLSPLFCLCTFLSRVGCVITFSFPLTMR